MISLCASLIFTNILFRLHDSSVVKHVGLLWSFFSIEVSVMFPLMCKHSLHVLDIPFSVLVIANVFPSLSSASSLYSWCALLNRKPDFNVIRISYFIIIITVRYMLFGYHFKNLSPPEDHVDIHLYCLLWSLCLCHRKEHFVCGAK